MIVLEQGYWLRRKRSSLAKAQAAMSAEARLVHFDLAGRYSVQAANAGNVPDFDSADAQPEFEITEADLATLIPRFYERVRDDPLIGPVFETRSPTGNCISTSSLLSGRR